MTDEERIKRIAALAWEIQPNFRHKFSTIEELEASLHRARGQTEGIFGYFLPLTILETLSSLESYKNTIHHAELDSFVGESTVHPDDLARAQHIVSIMGPLIPTLREHCGDWLDD